MAIIRAVMKTMLTSKEFFSQARVSRQDENAVRDGGQRRARDRTREVDFAFPLANQIAQLGEPLYRKLEPTGYSNANSEWVNSAALLARMNFALALAQNKVPGSKLDASQFSGEPGRGRAPDLVH